MLERLQKYMARCGVGSRRSCENLITQGRVKVNGNLTAELGTKIDPETDKILVDENIIKPESNKVYIALNKPAGYVSTVKDDRGRKTILDLIDIDERIYPIGRLDYDTEGLIFLTNDGDIYNKIIHPRKSINKIYIAEIHGIPNDKELKQFETGVDIGDYITAPAKIKIVKKLRNSCICEITIHEGKNRQIRRMCEKINHNVITLKRISIAGIELENLKSGEYRNLTEHEIEYLKHL